MYSNVDSNTTSNQSKCQLHHGDEESFTELDIFTQIEQGIKTKIPLTLKNILIINGYDNPAVFRSISNKDMEAVEQFMRTTLHTVISESERKNFYGPVFFQNPEKFFLAPGHRNLIFLIKNFFEEGTKHGVDKSTMTDGLTLYDKASSLESSRSSFNSTSLQTEILNTDFTEENALVCRIQKQWAKSKISEEQWNELDCETKFNNVIFNTSSITMDETTDDLTYKLVCKVTCFCKSHIKIYKVAKSKTTKARWISANFQKHFIKHFEKCTPSQITPVKVRTSNSSNKIMNYFKKDSKRDSKVSVIEKQKAKDEAKESSKNVHDNFHNDLVVKGGGDDVLENTSNAPSSKLKILQCVTLHNFARKPELKNNAEFPDTQFETISTTDLKEIQPSDENNKESYSKSLDLSETSTKNVQKHTMWTTMKYSRSERNRRKREKLQDNQTVITNFISVLEKIDKVINQNENILKEFEQTIHHCKNKGEPLTTNSFLNTLSQAASCNEQCSNFKNMYDNNFKKFCLYLFYCSGRLSYETLHANLNGILPSLSSLSRFKLKTGITVEEGQINFQGLEKFLNERALPKVVWLSEDATRINSKVEYNPRTNKVMGFSLPIKNGIPDPDAFIATSARDIQSYFDENRKADYGYVIMAQPLDPYAPAFCLSIFSSDNKFTSQDVLARWRYLKSELSSRGIKMLGISSDGDTRLLKAMKMGTPFVSEIEEPQKWFHLNPSLNLNDKDLDVCFMQDPTHIITKLKTRFLKLGVILPIGNFTASVSHLETLINTESKDKHLLTRSYLNSDDKMNFKSAEKICDDRVIQLLQTIPDSNATVMYLKIMNFIIASLIKKEEKLCDRVYKIWYCIFFLRYWRNWIRIQQKFSLQNNFITLNAYTCIELNGHTLIKLIKIFQKDESLDDTMFLPWLFNSQQCESLFRAARSMTSTFSTMINFSIKDFVSRIDRISYINFVLSDLREQYTFPREKNSTKICFERPSHEEIKNIDINLLVEKAMDDAYRDINKLGVNQEKDVAHEFDIKLSIESNNDVDNNYQSQDNMYGKHSDDQVFNTFLQNEADLNVGENTKNVLDNDIDLKDYSKKNVSLAADSPYLKVILPNNKSAVIKKSSYCWLLDEGNGRISTDRLSRFVSRKRKYVETKNTTTNKKLSNKQVEKVGKNALKKNKKRNAENESDSDSEQLSDEIVYDDSTDTESFSSKGNSEENNSFEDRQQNQVKKMPHVKIEEEKYYAVLYDEGWFIGRIINKVGAFKYKMKFLKRDLGTYVWPKEDDVAEVEISFIFYGPLVLSGTGIFTLSEIDVNKINKQYKLLRKK